MLPRGTGYWTPRAILARDASPAAGIILITRSQCVSCGASSDKVVDKAANEVTNEVTDWKHIRESMAVRECSGV